MPDIEYQNQIYDKAIDLLSDIKLCLGPTGLAGTLRKHPILKTFISKVQKERLRLIEEKIPNSQLDFLKDSLDD